MRHNKTRRGGRRRRVTRRLRKQRGGAILGTESIAQWLEKVSESFDTVKSRVAESTPAVYDFKSFENIPDFESGVSYIMPLEIKVDAAGAWKAVMPNEIFGAAQAENYALNGNYGRAIRANVADLTQNNRSDEFRAAVTNATEDLAHQKINDLLLIEEILRKILREHRGVGPVAEPVRSLSDESKYPLYIWAVAMKTGEGELIPMLTPPAPPAE